ncbi:MAG: methyltransferase, partial [Myxococcota bacterium]
PATDTRAGVGNAMVDSDPRFKVFRAFNLPELAPRARLRKHMAARALPAFEGAGPATRLARALADHHALAVKEVVESFEFHYRVRRRLRGPRMADLCAGHGLVGLLFATERVVEHVLLVDRVRPPAFGRALAAVASVFPQVRDKVEFVEADVRTVELSPGTRSVAVHACGEATDACLDRAIAARGAIAVMPCCYQNAGRDAPTGLRGALGAQTATDVHRTYRLEEEGFAVDWTAVPAAVTPMNRILLARPRG